MFPNFSSYLKIPYTRVRKQFLTGSKAFFSRLAGFQPKDTDWIIIDDNPVGMNYCRSKSLEGVCVYEWRYMPAEVFIDHVLSHPFHEMQVVMFLVPGVAEHIGLSMDMLPRLRPLIDNLDTKHRYAEVIYESYLKNGSFTLTDDQLQAAYRCYLEARTKQA